MIVIAIITNDERINSIAPSVDEAIKYMENLIDKWLKEDEIVVFHNTILLDYKLGCRGYVADEDDSYSFFEYDSSDMYKTPKDITPRLIPIFRKYMKDKGYPFDDASI